MTVSLNRKGNGYELCVSDGTIRKCDTISEAIKMLNAIEGKYILAETEKVNDMKIQVLKNWDRNEYQKGYERALNDLEIEARRNRW